VSVAIKAGALARVVGVDLRWLQCMEARTSFRTGAGKTVVNWAPVQASPTLVRSRQGWMPGILRETAPPIDAIHDSGINAGSLAPLPWHGFVARCWGQIGAGRVRA
jgi:hypothetical protein